MSIQRFGAKRTRWVSKATGIEWERLWNRSGEWWLGRTVEDGVCRHAAINHRTMEVVWQPTALHMDTCPGQPPGRVTPVTSVAGRGPGE